MDLTLNLHHHSPHLAEGEVEEEEAVVEEEEDMKVVDIGLPIQPPIHPTKTPHQVQDPELPSLA